MTFGVRLSLLVMLASISTAHARCGKQDSVSPSLRSIDQIAKYMTSADRAAERLHHISPEEIVHSHCYRETPFSMQELTDGINEVGHTSPPQSRNIRGHDFVDSPVLLNALAQLTSSTPGQQSSYEADFSTIPSDCNQALCAAQALFGSKVGTQLLYLFVKDGINASHLSYSDAAPWKPSELDDVLLGVSDLPQGILPLKRILQLTHARRTGDNGENVAWSTITVTDRWSDRTSPYRRITIVHEITHNISDDSNGLDRSPEWISLGGWSYAGHAHDHAGNEFDRFHSSKPREIVSRYASENPQEDLAESAVAYRYHPAYFKRVSPAKYEFVKDHIFRGIEYTDNNCSEKTIPNYWQ